MKAIIMAGGAGTRLRPLTNNIPKPMVPMVDRPVLYYTINLLKQYGIVDIAITLGYKPEKIIEYFGDGKDFGVRIKYYIEEFPMGTAGGVKSASDFVDGAFLVLSGDSFTNLALDAFVEYHNTTGGLFTLAAKEVDDPKGFGVIKTDAYGKVVKFIEKPKDAQENLINTGIYMMEKKVLDYIPDGFYDFGKQLIPNLLGEVYAYRTDCYWSDIGTLSSYYNTNSYLVQNPSAFHVDFI